MKDELYYRMALTMIPELGPVCARLLIEHFGDASSIFKAKKKDISVIEGIGPIRAKYLKEWNDFADAEAEIAFTEKHHIRSLFITDTDYPQRLLNCYDPPTL